MEHKYYLEKLFKAALEQHSPAHAVASAITLNDNKCQIKEHYFELTQKPVYILAVGKASVDMFNSVHRILGKSITDSLVITPDEKPAGECKAQKVMIGAHPVPDEKSVTAGLMATDFITKIPANSLLLCLISGGTSSLMCLPADGIGISELGVMYELLNNSGAAIDEMNTVRKHCSDIKGGQLLQFLNPHATLIDLMISDIPNDDPSMIGSGPTLTDSTTFQDTYHILLEYNLWEKIPEAVKVHIEKGIAGEDAETLKPKQSKHKEHYSYIISSAGKLATGISEMAAKEGFVTQVEDAAFNDDVETVAAYISNKILEAKKSIKPQLFIFYGESMVKVTGKGKGGRNQELALRGALKIAGHEHITWLSAGTDGVDGPTDAAGAIVDGGTVERALQKGIKPEDYLRRNDSYHFHKLMGSLFKTGPTGNNLMDLVLVCKYD